MTAEEITGQATQDGRDGAQISEADLKLIFSALAFAARKHKDQRRKDRDASPYINHPIALANILINEAHITDAKLICGALLHDTIEDTGTTSEELQTEFGTEVCTIVMDVTDDKSLNKALRKQAQIDHAEHACQHARLVKLADKIANLRDISSQPPANWSMERKQAYFDWARAVVERLRGVHPRLEALFDEAYAQRPES